MHLALRPHPDSSAPAASISVDIARSAANELQIAYNVTATGLALPPLAAPARTDELWKHTCLEAFIQTEAGYYEFNFSPSTQWAAYRFSSYREGMTDAFPIPSPRIESSMSKEGYRMEVALDPSTLPDLPAGPWSMAITAILEDALGAKSYWALAHAPGKPDFHRPEGFTLQLAAA